MVQLEYLAVYGRASVAASVSAQHMVKSLTLNPYMSLFNLKLCTHILFGQQILILHPPYIGLFGPSWPELSPYG